VKTWAFCGAKYRIPHGRSVRSFNQHNQGERLAMKNQLKKLITDESGQDVAEYAMLLVLVAIAIAIASPTITNAVLSVFSRTRSVLGV
jgi:Flp pilus assembly pilin Flp